MVFKTILRLPEVMARTGLSRSTIYSKMDKREFPQSISLGLRAVGWDADEIDSHNLALIEASRKDDQ